MSQSKKNFHKVNVNLPFPYPLLSSNQCTIWPFKEEGFVLIHSILCQSDKLVIVNESAAAFTLLKMGFFGFNSSKEITHLFHLENLAREERNKKQTSASSSTSSFTLGYYSLNSVDIPSALTKFEHDANQKEQSNHDLPGQPDTRPVLKLCLEEAYFLSYVFGILLVAKSPDEYYNLKQLWTCFCEIYEQNNHIHFAVKYAAYHYFRSKGWVVRNGFKFGTDCLLYKEGPPFSHALYSVIITYKIDDEEPETSKFKWNEISALTRVTKNARKQLIHCIVTIPKGILQDIASGPECIQHFMIDLIHVNRWNAGKGDFDSAKIFQNQ